MYPRISWSSLQNWEECPQRHLLARQRKRSLIPERYILVGNVLHFASEQLILGCVPEQLVVADALADFDRRVAESTSLGWDDAEREEQRAKVELGAWRLVEMFADEFGSVELGHLKSEMHLFQFYPGWCLEGYMDVAVLGGSRGPVTRVYDVKTGTSHKAGQLQFYGVLCEAYFGERPETLAWIEPLARGVVEVAVLHDEHMAMKKRIMDAVIGIQAEAFTTDGFPKKCSRCSSEAWCPATNQVRAMKLREV